MISYILAAAGLSILASLSGVIFFSRFEKIKEHIQALIGLSVGAFLAVTFVDLIPAAIELSPDNSGPYFILGGFLGFVAISHFVSVFHHHHGENICEDCEPELQRTGFLVLIGDIAHNFVDGIVITAAFLVHPAAGIATTAGVLLHEIPQEIAEFFVLIRAGYSRSRALLLNFLVSTSVAFGAIIAYFFATQTTSAIGPLMGIAAGNLIYIAATDLLPELFTREGYPSHSNKDFIQQFLLLILGAVIVISILQIGGEHDHGPTEPDTHEHATHTLS